MGALVLAAHRWVLQGMAAEDGQGLVEYTMILLLASIVAIAALTGLGNTMVTKLYTLSNSF